jgi:hypothetical protein
MRPVWTSICWTEHEHFGTGEEVKPSALGAENLLKA